MNNLKAQEINNKKNSINKATDLAGCYLLI